MYADVHSYMYTHIYTYLGVYIHMYTYIYIYIYTHTINNWRNFYDALGQTGGDENREKRPRTRTPL